MYLYKIYGREFINNFLKLFSGSLVSALILVAFTPIITRLYTLTIWAMEFLFIDFKLLHTSIMPSL